MADSPAVCLGFPHAGPDARFFARERISLDFYLFGLGVMMRFQRKSRFIIKAGLGFWREKRFRV